MDSGRPARHPRLARHAASVVMLFAAVWGAVPAIAASPGGNQESKAAKLTPLDARAMVEALANRNPVPNPVKASGRCYMIYAKNFNELEGARAFIAFLSLIDRAEGVWQEMVGHLDDGRYCTTAYDATEGAYAFNLSVGEACREIIVGYLTEGYLHHLHLDKMGYARMQMREVTSNRKKLKAWCDERSTKHLYELQIEMCQWAISELEKGGFGKEVPTPTLLEWVAAVRSEITSLKVSKKALHFRGFGESMAPYTRTKADELRRRYGASADRTVGEK